MEVCVCVGGGGGAGGGVELPRTISAMIVSEKQYNDST